jgi:hypothetical protein
VGFPTRRRCVHTSSASLKTVKGPSYSGFGVYSKSSISALTISRLVMRNPYNTESVVVGRRENSTHLTINHVRNHHDLIRLVVWELERRLGRLDIEGHDDGLGSTDSLLDEVDGDVAVESDDFVPKSDSNVCRDGQYALTEWRIEVD